MRSLMTAVIMVAWLVQPATAQDAKSLIDQNAIASIDRAVNAEILLISLGDDRLTGLAVPAWYI